MKRHVTTYDEMFGLLKEIINCDAVSFAPLDLEERIGKAIENAKERKK